MSRSGHPLPDSDEARHSEVPEHLEREKGRGEDSRPVVQPDQAVNPDGEPYRYDDLGRGPGSGAGDDEAAVDEEFAADQAEHQDRGQSLAETESDEG